MAKTTIPPTPDDDSSDPTVPPLNPVLPTEQIPAGQIRSEPSPVSASAAASGGATGPGGAAFDGGETSADEARSPKQSVFRRHPLATGITAGVIAVVIVSGLTAWGVGSAVTASLTGNTAQLAPATTASPTPVPAAGGKAAGRVAFRATITSISGSTWTITTIKGQTVTIAVDSATQFGTKKMAETASSFSSGDSVVIVATRDVATGTATATRVVSASDLPNRLKTGPGTPTPAPTSTTNS